MNPRGQILIIQNDPWLKDATLKLFLTLFCHHFTRNSKIFPDAQKLHNQIKEGLFSTLMRNKYYLFLFFFYEIVLQNLEFARRRSNFLRILEGR